jgi:hypothetical protein
MSNEQISFAMIMCTALGWFFGRALLRRECEKAQREAFDQAFELFKAERALMMRELLKPCAPTNESTPSKAEANPHSTKLPDIDDIQDENFTGGLENVEDVIEDVMRLRNGTLKAKR